LSSELKSADLDGEDLAREILACENKVYETFLGPQPDVEAFRKLTLPDYLYINYRGVIWNREENIIIAKKWCCFFVYSNQRVAGQEAFTDLSLDRRPGSHRSRSWRTQSLHRHTNLHCLGQTRWQMAGSTAYLNQGGSRLNLNSEVEKSSSSFSCSSSSSRILTVTQTEQNNCQEDRLFHRRRSPINRGRGRGRFPNFGIWAKSM